MPELALAVAFLVALLAIGIGGATSTGGFVELLVFELCCLFAMGLVVTFELLPAALALRARTVAVRRFRRQLDELPETPHPLDQVTHRRSNRSD
jgi:hypothetical protein